MKVYIAYQYVLRTVHGASDEGITKIFDSEEKAIAWINDTPDNYTRHYEELEVE